MAVRDLLEACCGCFFVIGLFAALVCFWVFGGLALSDAFHYTSDCGLWLWVSTLVSLVFFPCMAVMLAVAVYMAVKFSSLFGGDVEVAGDTHAVLGCGIGMMVTVLNLFPAASAGFLAEGLWGESCIPHSSDCGVFAQLMFYSLVIGIGLEVLAVASGVCLRCCA